MKQPSLASYLWRWTLAALAAAWLALMLASYFAGLHEAGEIADGHLASAANVLLQLPTIGTSGGALANGFAMDGDAGGLLMPGGRHLKLARSVAVLVWEQGRLVSDTRAPGQRGNLDFPDGYATTVVVSGPEREPHRWRSFSAQRPDGTRRVTAMLDLDQPTRIVREVAFTIARPSLVVLPLVALLLWWAIRRGLRPLNDLSAKVGALDPSRSDRIDESHGFAEFASTVAAINALIGRLRLLTEAERAFASDVAHELRTPLAAIALQAEVAAAHPDAAQRAQALARLQRESLRAGQILRQLLDLARAQRQESATLDPVCLDELAAGVMAGFAQRSHDSGHVLELRCGDRPVHVNGNVLLLELALRNLIDNALGHTGAGTQVIVEVGRRQGAVVLSVSDDGATSGAENDTPGPQDAVQASHEHLGIGLRLVERIAATHHAQLVHDAGDPGMTTRFAIVWKTDGQSD